MLCPKCGWRLDVQFTTKQRSKILHRRNRKCRGCGKTFVTVEIPFPPGVRTHTLEKIIAPLMKEMERFGKMNALHRRNYIKQLGY